MAGIGVLDCFCSVLNETDGNLIAIALEGLENMLTFGAIIAQQEKTHNKILEELDAKGGLRRIEALQNHGNNEVYERALKILDNFVKPEM